MGPMVGISKSKRLQYHIIKKCKKYQERRPITPPAPDVSASTTVNQSYRAQRNSVKPKPLICKKKKGACNHIIAFGDHYDRKAWQAYEEFLANQRPETNVSNC